MPPPSSENDLKRLARRRLIGAVALILLAVIVLPLLLEDEPPPAGSLEVRMAASPEPVPEAVAHPEPAGPPEMMAMTPLAAPAEPQAASRDKPALQTRSQPAVTKPAPHPETEPAKPVLKPEPAKPAAKLPSPLAAKTPPAAQVKPAATAEVYVVQLAALSDSAKAQTLKARAAQIGLPAYTDSLGSLTRVRVGPYPSREAAAAAVAKLTANGLSGGQVLTQ